MDPKIDFWKAFWLAFLGASFLIDFVLILLVFFNARNLKNHAPVEAGAQFLQNRDFRRTHQNSSKPKNRTPVEAGAQFLQNRCFCYKSKNRSKNH